MLLLMCAFVAVLWWRKVAAELKLAVKMAKYKLEGKCMVISWPWKMELFYLRGHWIRLEGQLFIAESTIDLILYCCSYSNELPHRG